MIDLILMATIGAAFYVGFKAGNKHASLKDLVTALKAKLG